MDGGVDMSVAPLKYQGQVVTTHKELRDLISIDSFEDAIGYVRAVRAKENESSVPEVDRNPCTKVDPTFHGLVQECKPVGQYFEQTMGDKLLYLKRIDGLSYDVIEQHLRLKEAQANKQPSRTNKYAPAKKHRLA